jgi:hypothetical protein
LARGLLRADMVGDVVRDVVSQWAL